MDARQVLPFLVFLTCFWPVSDLFLTFPGVFFNFKKISTGSAKRETLLVIVKVKWLLVLEILVLVELVVVELVVVVVVVAAAAVVVVIVVVVEVGRSRSSNDKRWGGWMDGC